MIASMPTEGLIGRLTLRTMLLAVGPTLGLLLVSRAFWKFGVKYYSGASA